MARQPGIRSREPGYRESAVPDPAYDDIRTFDYLRSRKTADGWEDYLPYLRKSVYEARLKFLEAIELVVPQAFESLQAAILAAEAAHPRFKDLVKDLDANLGANAPPEPFEPLKSSDPFFFYYR